MARTTAAIAPIFTLCASAGLAEPAVFPPRDPQAATLPEGVASGSGSGLPLRLRGPSGGPWPLCTPTEAVLRIENCYDPADGNDWSPAIRRAIDSFPGVPYPATGGKIQFGPGTYPFSQTIELDRTIVLEGQGTSGDFGGTILLFAPDTTGILVHFAGTSADPQRRGDRSMIRGLTVQSLGGTSGHGIQLLARANLEYVYVARFPENGIHIAADVNHVPPTNANTWRMHAVFSFWNGGHGLYVEGGDTNTGVAVAFDAMYNGGWGVYDSSFLGNTYVGAHTAINGLGGYKSDGRNARNLFLNCYSEGDQPPSQIVAPAIVIGGLLEIADLCTTPEGMTPCDYAGFDSSGFTTTFPNGLRAVNDAGSPTASMVLTGSSGVPGTAYELHQSGEPSWPYRMTFDATDAWWKMRWANLGAGVAYAMSVSATAEGYAQFWMPNGFHFGAASGKIKQDAAVEGGVAGMRYLIAGASRFVGWATAAPGSGSFGAGDVIWNSGGGANAGWRFDGSAWQPF